MKRLELPHQLADYLCPVNGLCDVYEWKTGKRIPEELIFYSKAGFQMISQKKAAVPKMIFMGQGSIGKREYEFWKGIIGYEVTAGEGKCFRTTMKNIRELLDKDIPVILFGLDMFHLLYQSKFYHRQHIPGHVVLMTGYDEANVYVHDNSKAEVQTIPIAELELAWAEDYIGISKKNAYFGIDMKSPETDMAWIVRKGIGEFSEWNNIFSEKELQKIYSHFIEYTGSILPELPYEISRRRSGIINPHRASRDKFAQTLVMYKDFFGEEAWEEAAHHFQKGGEIIEKIVDGFIEDVTNCSFGQPEKYIPLFQVLRGCEEEAFCKILYTQN